MLLSRMAEWVRVNQFMAETIMLSFSCVYILIQFQCLYGIAFIYPMENTPCVSNDIGSYWKPRFSVLYAKGNVNILKEVFGERQVEQIGVKVTANDYMNDNDGY